MSNIPDERHRIPTSPAQAAEHSHDSPDSHAPDTTHYPQPDNRLSVVSAGAVSLEPRRRSRHHHGHHHHSRNSHLHRELSHMLSVSSRDAKELRRGLSAAFDRLDQSRVRASHAEKLALDTLLRVREAETERADAMRHASTTREELGRYKALLDNAHGEIRRAQQMLRDQEQLRYEAEASAAHDRDTARLMKQRRLIDLAREQGRKIGFNEGIQAGQRLGYYEGRSPTEDEELYPNEGPRFREMFDESRYRLDEFDQPPPFRDTYLNLHDAEIPTPLPRRQVYPRLQGQHGTSGLTIDATNPVSEPTHTMPPTEVQRTSLTDSSSTTTLPAAPPTLHVSSRAPPPMPTIPEVPSTEVGSARSRSPRDSPRTQSHIQHTSPPQVSTNADILPPVVRYSQGDVAFVPPPGIVDTHTGPVNGNRSESGPHIYESPSPRRAFDNPLVLNSGTISDVSRSSVYESPAREHFETLPQPVRSPAREHFETFPQHIRSPAREQFETLPQPIRSPAREHFETFPQPTRSPAREHFEIFPQPIRSPARERSQSSPEAIRDPLRGHSEASSRAMQNPARERFETPTRAIPSPLQERFSTNHHDSPKVSRAHSEGVRFVDDLRNPESSTRPRSRPGGQPSQRDGPPRQRPIPQMPAPLGPPYGVNPSYAYGPYGTAQRGRQPQSNYRMPHDASLNAASNPASNWYPHPSQVMPNLAQRSMDRAPEQPTHAPSPRISSGQLPHPGTTHDPSLTTAPPALAAVGRPRSPQNPLPVRIPPTRYSAPDPASPIRSPARERFETSSRAIPSHSQERFSTNHRDSPKVTRAQSEGVRDVGDPRNSESSTRPSSRPGDPPPQRDDPPRRRPSEQLPHPGTTHDSPLTTAIPAFANDYPAGLPRSPQNLPPIQIPPTRYSASGSGSPRLATSPATGSHRDIPPAETYSPRATSPNPNIRASGSVNQSPPRRYPPTLYNEPHLQRQPTTVASQQEHRVSTPVLPVPSRSRATAPGIVIPPADHFNGGPWPRTAITSSRTGTPTDTLPVRPPSVSPRPSSPAAYAQPIPPPQGATPRRPVSPNPLPRGVSPAPLPRASSPVPLPVRSPSVRSTHIHRSTSDVSLPGAPGSPYKRYNPNMEADIAMLASSSVERFARPSR